MQTRSIGTPTPPRSCSTIRWSTEKDISAIHAWLVEEKAKDVHGNFLCHWSATKESHEEGRLLVFVDGLSRIPVAYQWGDLVRPGILQVRHDMRGKGIGRKLVARRMEETDKCDEPILFIECNPSASIPFWKAMGFTLIENQHGKNNAYRVVEKKHSLPADGRIADVVIRFCPERRKRDKTATPRATAMPAAASTPDGVVHLSERVCFFDWPRCPTGDDVVVEIEVDGELRFCDKAKYDEAKLLGVRRCTNGFYIDFIQPPQPSHSG